MNVNDRLSAVFADIFWSESGPPPERTKNNTPAWDSLAHVNLVLAIEQEFGISLKDDEILELNSFAVAEAIVSERLAQTG